MKKHPSIHPSSIHTYIHSSPHFPWWALWLMSDQKVKKNSVDYDKSEDHLRALQSVGQIIGEVLSLGDVNDVSSRYRHYPRSKP